MSDRGAKRWTTGHPWIYRSDVREHPPEAGVVAVRDGRGRFLGRALCSPSSEIRLRLLERRDVPIDGGWWRERLTECRDRRLGLDAPAWRAGHARCVGWWRVAGGGGPVDAGGSGVAASWL